MKTLRHSHVCGRSFDPNVRARELQVAAEAAVKAVAASFPSEVVIALLRLAAVAVPSAPIRN